MPSNRKLKSENDPKTSRNNQVEQFSHSIQCKDHKGAEALLDQVFEASNMSNTIDLFGGKSKVEMEGIISLIIGINPQDTVEMMLTCQFVATHIQSLFKLSQDETSHGMMLMRISHQALDMLQKYRNKDRIMNDKLLCS